MLSVVVPSYNERQGIGLLIERVHQALEGIEHEVFVVDDSNDGTDDLLQLLAESDPQLQYLHREGERGLARAVVLGFELVQGDVLCVMDADLQHPPELLPTMYKEILAGADIVIPSRFLPGSRVSDAPPLRRAFSMGGKWFSKLLLRSLWQASDPLGGFLMLRRSVIEGVWLRPVGWRVQMEVLSMGRYSSVVEIPYSFQRRYAGHSKMGVRHLLEDAWHVLLLIMRNERERRFYLFALVGLLGVLINMLLFYLLHTLMGLGLELSVILCAICVVFCSYALNRHITWRHVRRHGTLPVALEILRFSLVFGAGIVVKNLVMQMCMVFSIPAGLANVLGIVAAMLYNYVLCVCLVFPREERLRFIRRTRSNGGDGI